MNLKSIKLAGFKSFVDPTVISLDSPLTGIVGPNGCGKSNVVDAIRWVIGEISAKQLRGQSMSDVIFSGTNNRKPVGKASVELLFDNNDGRLVGEYAKFSEISVRREVHREGQSQYFLNGTSCRRRDIIDVFLGTGLGARSYAIIEQGMISQLIEAKPEELRAHLEEVAGISKYKERRRETENRMRHTRENLDRLHDLNEELTKQLRHLKRQSESAKKYADYKQQERTLHAQIKVLHWQALAEQSKTQDIQLAQQATLQEEQQAMLSHLDTALEKNRAEQIQTNEQRDAIQKQYYGLGAEIARLEQRIQHRQEQVTGWQKELTDVEALCQELEDHHEDQRQNIDSLSSELVDLEPETQAAKQQAQTAKETLETLENQMQAWQQGWDHFQAQTSQSAQQSGVLKTNLTHYQQQLTTVETRRAQLMERQQQLPLVSLNKEIEPLVAQVNERRQSLASLEQTLTTLRADIQTQRQHNTDLQTAIDQQRQQLQTLQGRYTTLEALQQSALGFDDDHTKDWLSEQAIEEKPRLGQVLQVNPGWEMAVEMVLGGYFDAVCVEDTDALIQAMTDLSGGCLTLIDQKNSQAGLTARHSRPSLASQIQSQWPLNNFLAHVYIADDLSSALSWRAQLNADESVITRDGVWLGKHWVRINKSVNTDDGVLVREKNIKSLSEELATLHQQLQVKQSEWEQGGQTLRRLEEERETQHQSYQAMSASLTDSQTQLSARESRLSELQQQQQRLLRDIHEAEDGLAHWKGLSEKAQEEFAALSQTEQTQTAERAELLTQRDQCRDALNHARQAFEQQRRLADELSVRLAATENQLTLLKQNSLHEQRQQQQLSERRELLEENLSQNDEPLVGLQADLQQQLTARLTIESDLRVAEDNLNQVNQQLDQLTQQQQDTRAVLERVKNELQAIKMNRQEITVRQTTLEEQLDEQSMVLKDVMAELPEQANVPEWDKQLETLSARVNRLGPINLAAIDEYEAVNERKTYLDKQQADLLEALDILDSAIAKIDRETRAKFQEAYETVNKHFQALFPRVFGGGKAVLELSEENWLTTGVLVKAQPPGKRNTSIHMLSGGEKALTAIALVFSMFQLNPAPFCVLDEVDAPLDDANVGRFCQLVKEMAKTTQFIVISHNKVTISMSDRLMGVTMQEAGVSRIVSVDVAEAVAMADL